MKAQDPSAAAAPAFAVPAQTIDAEPVAPVAPGERISSIDVIRGVSLLGILLMNIVSFGLPGAAYGDPTVAGGDSGPNLAAWLVNQLLFEGKMRTIFSMLFGAGVILFTARAEERGGGARGADLYYRRTLWLLAFGLAHAYFVWVGDILFFYGLVGLFLFPLRQLPGQRLLLAGLLVLGVLAAKYYLEGRSFQAMRQEAAAAADAAAAGQLLTAEQLEAQKAWAEKLQLMKPKPDEIAKEIADHRAGYWTAFQRRQREVLYWQTTFNYRFGFFDVAGMMLLGMGFMKLGIFSAARSVRFYLMMVLLGYGIGIPVNAFFGYRNLASGFDPAGQYINWSAYDLGRLSVACAHIGLTMLVVKAGMLRWLTSRLAAVGRIALTNYLSQSIICTTLFDRFGLYGSLQRHQLLYVVVAVWVFQLIVSPIWIRHFRFGPAEWAWRSLVYWRRQPMRSPAAGPAQLQPAAT